MSRTGWLMSLSLVTCVALYPDLTVHSSILCAQEPSAKSGRQPEVGLESHSRESVQDSNQAEASPQMANARQTLEMFVIAVEEKDFRTAVLALDFSKVDPAPDDFARVAYAQQLKACIDRMALLDPLQISDDPQGDPVPFPPDKADSPIVIQRDAEGKWRFSAETVAEINSLYEILKEKPVLGEVVTSVDAEQPKTPPPESSSTDSPESTDVAKPTIDVPEALKSARRTMRSLFNALNTQDYPTAVAAMDFSELEATGQEIGPYMRLGYAPAQGSPGPDGGYRLCQHQRRS